MIKIVLLACLVVTCFLQLVSDQQSGTLNPQLNCRTSKGSSPPPPGGNVVSTPRTDKPRVDKNPKVPRNISRTLNPSASKAYNRFSAREGVNSFSPTAPSSMPLPYNSDGYLNVQTGQVTNGGANSPVTDPPFDSRSRPRTPVRMLEQTGRSLQQFGPYPCKYYTIDLTSVYTQCPANGFWIRLHGTGFVWLQINGVIINYWPYFPYSPIWVRIPSNRTRCGCNKVRIWFWTCLPFLSWRVYIPRQTCMRNCPTTYSQFWNPRTCRCTCKNRCCYWPWQNMSLYTPCRCR